MNAWDNENCGTPPNATEPSGQKCLYKVIITKNLIVTLIWSFELCTLNYVFYEK